ncbi:MAG: amidohydrolase family protein [Acidobacteriota bacterium]
MSARALAAAALLLAVPAAPDARAETIALTGATVHTVSGRDLPNAVVLLRDGKIAAVGAEVAVPPDARRVDLSGRHLYPSLIPPVTVLGLVEIQSVRATVDTTELGEVNPQARADFAVNFDSELLPVARSAGILVAGITPIGGIVSGSLAAMKLDGWTREDATVLAPAAVFVVWPDLAIDRSPSARFSARIQEKRRDEALRKLREAFSDARAYGKARSAEGGAGIPRHDFDPRLEALLPAVEGRIPVVVEAHTVAQIRAALAWSREEKLSATLFGVEDGWRIAPEIARAGVAAIVRSLPLPLRADEPYDAAYANAGALSRAGVAVAFDDGAETGTAPTVRDLPHQASAAVAYGFPREKAVAAMTLEPARILRIADRLGSIEAGKDATLIVTDGDVLDLRTHVVGAWLDGRPLDLNDKQKRLWERYRARPRKSAEKDR